VLPRGSASMYSNYSMSSLPFGRLRTGLAVLPRQKKASSHGLRQLFMLLHPVAAIPFNGADCVLLKPKLCSTLGLH
jgi:hypothetical protein